MVVKAHRQNKTFPKRCWDWRSLFCLAWLGLWQYESSYGLFPLRKSSPFYLCVIPVGLFALVVFNRWRICRELRELAWQEWIDSVSPIARQCGIESAVIR